LPAAKQADTFRAAPEHRVLNLRIKANSSAKDIGQSTDKIMKINGNAVRPGMVIEHQGKLWRAVKIQHTQPGKGGAYLQVELKDLRSGSKLNERFRAAETVERARLDQKEYQFLFSDDGKHTFMDNDTYDQIVLDGSTVSEEQAIYLQDGMQVMLESYEESPIGIQLPDHVTLEVTEADAVVKGQTASSSYKPATLANGIRTSVPPHIETGTRIVVATENGTYVERAKD
jgi:elongation factor P